MALTLLPPEQVATAGLARLGIYGVNGNGKTTLLSTVPPELKMVVVSPDAENIKPLIGRPNTLIQKVRRWDELFDLADLLRQSVGQIDVIAFDTWSRLQALALNKVARGNFTPADGAKALLNMPTTAKGWETWEKVGALAGDGMRVFLEMPFHFIFLFQEDTRNLGKLEDVIQTGPALTPAALRVAREALEIVGRLYVVDAGKEQGALNLSAVGSDINSIDVNRQDKRMLLLGKHDRYFTKGPTHKLGYVVENPTWEKLAPAWEHERPALNAV